MAKLNRKNLLLVNFVLLFAIILILSNYRSVSVANRILNDKIQPIVNNDQYKNDFERVVSKWCDPRNISLNYICLNRVNELDRTSNNFIKPVCSNEDKIVFHTFWQFGSDSSFYMRVLKLNVMSFLSTQNLDCSKLILWTLNSFSPSIKSNILNIFDFYVRSRVLEVRQFDIKELCREASDKKAHFAKSSVCLFSNKQDYSDIYNMVGFSDLIRFFVLDIYGGLYVDGDILFLKDMSILSNYNFAYRWSYTTNYNTAVMGINRKLVDKSDQLYSIFINETTNSISNLISQLHPNELSRLVRVRLGANSEIFSYDALQVFHSCFFDPAWLCFDGVVKNPDPTFVCSPIDFTNRKLIDSNKFRPDDFFPGAFTYHLHLSRRDFNFSSDSYFGYFESYFSKTLKLN